MGDGHGDGDDACNGTRNGARSIDVDDSALRVVLEFHDEVSMDPLAYKRYVGAAVVEPHGRDANVLVAVRSLHLCVMSRIKTYINACQSESLKSALSKVTEEVSMDVDEDEYLLVRFAHELVYMKMRSAEEFYARYALFSVDD